MTKADDLEALGEVDRKSKISRTDTQAGTGAAALVAFCFAAAYFHLDLNPYTPGYQSSFPVLVEAAFFTLGTALTVRWMNRKPKTDPEAGQSDVRGLLTLLVTVLVAAILALVLYRLLNHQATGL